MAKVIYMDRALRRRGEAYVPDKVYIHTKWRDRLERFAGWPIFILVLITAGIFFSHAAPMNPDNDVRLPGFSISYMIRTGLFLFAMMASWMVPFGAALVFGYWLEEWGKRITMEVVLAVEANRCMQHKIDGKDYSLPTYVGIPMTDWEILEAFDDQGNRL